jgi:hypothetical protein
LLPKFAVGVGRKATGGAPSPARAGAEPALVVDPLGTPAGAAGGELVDGCSEIEAAVTVLPPPFASVVRGVGISHTTSVRVTLVVVVVGLGALRFAVAFLDPRESPTVGDGKSCAATAESVRSPLLPRWFGSPFSPSDALGVGRVVTAVGNCPRCPPPRQSRAAGVGRPGGEPQPLTLVGCTDIRRSQSRPLRIEPESGKVGEDIGKPKSNVSCDVLKEAESGS